MKRTTDLDKLLSNRNVWEYCWGEIIQFHHIGEYDIIEYYPWWYEEGESTYESNRNLVHFAIYIDGKDIGEYAPSLDDAIVAAIAYKYEGQSSAVKYFMRMIKRIEGGKT